MDDQDIKDLVNRLADGPPPTHEQTDRAVRSALARRRHVRWTQAGVTAAAAAVIVAIPLIHDRDATTGPGPASPASTAPSPENKSTPADLCQSAEVATYAVNFPVGDPGAPDPDIAAAPWAQPGEPVTTTRHGETTAHAAMGPSGAPRQVLTVQRTSRGWVVSATTACLEPATADPQSCGSDTVTFDGQDYILETRRAGAPGVGRVLGQAQKGACVDRDGETYQSRDAIGPVTAYQANEQDPREAIVITRDKSTHLYTKN